MLFTADLKSFSSYGLPRPSSSTAIADTDGDRKVTPVAVLPTPPLTPSLSPAKRKRGGQVTTQCADADEAALSMIKSYDNLQSDKATSLADRVKKRRRVTAAVAGKDS